MNLNELHYLIGAMGFGIFFISGLITLFNHGWRFPYKWYVAMLFYVCGLFVLHMPFMDSICCVSAHASLMRDLLSEGIVPLTMLSMCKFARLGWAQSAVYLTGVCLGLVGVTLELHGALGVVLGWASMGLVGGTMLVWCVMCCRSFLDGSDSEYLKVSDKRWFAQFAVMVVLLAMAPLAVRMALPYLQVERLVLMGNLVTLLPLLLYFQYQHGDLVFRSREEVRTAA